MSRNTIIMILYIMMFLISAYIKFTNPHLFGKTSNDLSREIVKYNGNVVLGEEENEMRASWPIVRGKERFDFKLAKMIAKINFDDENKGISLLQISKDGREYNVELREHVAGSTETDKSSPFSLSFLNANEFDNNEEFYIFYEYRNDMIKYDHYYRIVKDNNGTKIKKLKDKLKLFNTIEVPETETDISKNGTNEFVDNNFILYPSIESITVFKKINLRGAKSTSYNPLSHVYIENNPVGMTYERMSQKSGSSESDGPQYNFKTDELYIDLLNETFTIVKDKAKTDTRVNFPVYINVADSAHLSGNYADIITDVNSNKINCPPHFFSIVSRENVATDFQILHPPDGYEERMNTPIGMPFRQTVSATFPIDRVTLQIENKVLVDNVDLTGLTDGISKKINDLVYITSSNNRKVLDIEFPVTTEKILNHSGALVDITLKAKSAQLEKTRNWKIEVIGLSFQVWPPVKPQRLQGYEKELVTSFVNTYKDEISYPLNPQRPSCLDLVYETREVNVFYSLKNVNANHIKNIFVRSNNGESITEQPNELGYFDYKIGRDVQYIDLTVITNSNQRHRKRFFVRNVPKSEPDIEIDVSPSGEKVYIGSIVFNDYFGDEIEIDRMKATSYMSPDMSYNVLGNFINFTEANSKSRVEATFYYNLSYESGMQTKNTTLDLP